LKRSELVRLLLDAGCRLERHGARHDIFVNPANGKMQPVPRHHEISDVLAKHIRKQLGV
jgi:predicted RNA binding protein YcfA (HicA-like mRNA interferase family)